MSQLTKEAFQALYGTSGTEFPDNTSGQVNPSKLRTFGQNISESFSLGVSDIEYLYKIEDDFLLDVPNVSGTATGSGGIWDGETSGTSSEIAPDDTGINSTEKAHGVVQFQTGTTSTGFADMQSRGEGRTGIGFGTKIVLTFRLAVNILSTGSERFFVCFGLRAPATSSAGAEPSDGVYFKYQDNVNSGRWEAINMDGGIPDDLDTNISPSATVNQVFKISIEPDGSSIKFYIDGSLVVTSSVTPTTELLKPFITLKKTVGTTTRLVHVDFVSMVLSRVTSR